MVVRTAGLTKAYGSLLAIKDIDLELEQGDLFALIGPDGAGKTTVMRVLAAMLRPTSGEAYVGGYSIRTNADEIRNLVGFLPEFFGVYRHMKVIECLEFYASLYRIRGPRRRQFRDEMLKLVGLECTRDAFADSLSREQTRRLGIAQVLLHDPQVLLLDEPLRGLDSSARIEICDLLRRLAQTGRTIIATGRDVPGLSDVCSKIGIIDRGRMIVSGDVTEIMR